MLPAWVALLALCFTSTGAFLPPRIIAGTERCPSQVYLAGKSVYEDADPSKLIRVTDYLRNPNPDIPVAKEEPKAQEPASPSSVPKSSPVVSLTDEDIEAYCDLLREAITSFDSAAAKKIVDELAAMRSKSVDDKVTSQLFNALLEKGPDGHLPFWTRFRLLSRFSNRARLATLRRTLNLTTPPPNVEDEVEDTPEEAQRRRRRALISLLQTLARPPEVPTNSSGPAIVTLEKRAKKERKQKSSEDMRSRLPDDLETPKYSVIIEKDGYEIRKYEPFAVCSVSMREARPVDSKMDFKTDGTSFSKTGGAKAFGALAGYLFGKNQENASMKMTTPVLARGEEDAKTMSFVLPSEFWKDNGLSMAPKPLEGSGVVLERLEGEERAVIMFGGYASKSVVEEKKLLLLEKLEKEKDWVRAGKEPVVLSQYNDPFTPPWKRLNEVSVAVHRS